MFYDEILENIRKKPQKHAAQFNYLLHKIIKDLNHKNRKCKRKPLSFPPKLPQPVCLAKVSATQFCSRLAGPLGVNV